jgi:hypothetical protein
MKSSCLKHLLTLTPAVIVAGMLSAVTAQAAPIRFVGTLTPEGTPPGGRTGTGNVTVWFDPDADTLRVQATFSGLSGTTTASHIHCCTPLPFVGDAGVATTVPTFPGFPLGVMSGSFDQTYNTALAGTYNPAFVTANGGTPTSAEAALLAGMLAGRSYFNIHTTTFGGGEIRARLAVPEPTSLLLLGGGLAGLLIRRRRN